MLHSIVARNQTSVTAEAEHKHLSNDLTALFFPRRPRFVAAFGILLLEACIFLTGNYNWFNLQTMLLCLVLMSIGMTILVGLGGSLGGGLVGYLITGGRRPGGWILAVLASAGIVYLMQRRDRAIT